MQVRGSLASSQVFDALRQVALGHGLGTLEEELGAVERLSRDDLAACADELAALESDGSLVKRAGSHLLALGGKRLRPLCVALAARLGSGFGPQAQAAAVAVELVHSATLLHDDVVDMSDLRRGQPTARLVYGNAGSVFAGDWLLVEALRRVHATGQPELLQSLLATLEEIIAAESLQLERRGRIEADRDSYFRVVKGKTAALFRWACEAGARMGGLDDARVQALSAFGDHLGVAFQLVDDALDVAGEPAATGKSLLTDLREGKMTYPLVVALERDVSTAEALKRFLSDESGPDEVLARVKDTGAIEATRERAGLDVAQALEALDAFEPGPIRSALAAMALAVVHRSH